MNSAGSILMLCMTLMSHALSQDPTMTREVFMSGEELHYKVRWNFVRLGTIVIRTVRDSSKPGSSVMKLSMNVQSNPDLPFIWIWEQNESTIDVAAMSSKSFRASHRNGDDCYAVRQVHDDIKHTMVYTRTDLNSGRILRRDTLVNIGKYVEGPSLFFYARCLTRLGTSQTVATLIEGKLSSTELRATGMVDEVSIDAVDYPVRTRVLRGFAHWTGGSSAGISGEFAGWMSDDEAAIPVRAEMKILLGNITLELERWTRSGWQPPCRQTAKTLD